MCKMADSNGLCEFCKVGLMKWIKSFDEAPGKPLLIVLDLIKLVFNNLVFIPLGMLSPKIITFRFSDVRGSVMILVRGWLL